MLKVINRRLIEIVALIGCSLSVSTSWSGEPSVRTLENLERERAELIRMALSPSISAVERAEQINYKTRHMVDMERMVMRDDRLLGVNSSLVRRAFDNYDLTFMVHASIENNRHVVDHWLEYQGLTSAAILAARRIHR